MNKAMQWAVITPSYNLDFQRCKLLCRSMDAFLQGDWFHHIVVDPVDLPLFASLNGPRRTVINKQSILPKGFHYFGKVPFMRLGRLWWSWRHGPIFGWQMQQLVKISMASVVEPDAMMFLDSDTFFLRPFHADTLSRGNKVRRGWQALEGGPAYRSVANGSAVYNSIKLLGLSPETITKSSLHDQIVAWHRPTAVALQQHLSKVHGKPWQEAIGSTLMFSEYNLYDLFVMYVQKENPHLHEDVKIYCKAMWSKEAIGSQYLAGFCETLGPDQAAVCIQSLIGIDVKLLEKEFEKALLKQKTSPQPN